MYVVHKYKCKLVHNHTPVDSCVDYSPPPPRPQKYQARKAIALRSNMEKKLATKDRESKEENLRQLAQRARDERAGIKTADVGEEQCMTLHCSVCVCMHMRACLQEFVCVCAYLHTGVCVILCS